jgi:hypothetical protein
VGRLGDLFARNGAQWNGVKRGAEVWRNYVPALMERPDAKLNFDDPRPVEDAARAA